jgi:acetate kinase
VIGALRQFADLAPLHSPPGLLGIEVCREMLPGVPNVAVFDTAIHQTMPPKAYLYGLPIELYRTQGIRRYGFHGTSHCYVAREAAQRLGRPLDELKIITCHLGLKVDEARNARGHILFSTDDSAVHALAIPTDEERVIARDTCALVAQRVGYVPSS